MAQAYLNTITTAVPPHDIHDVYVAYAPSLLKDERERKMFHHLAHRAQIEHRYSFLRPHPQALALDGDDFYLPGQFPATEQRMQFYKKHAFSLAKKALDELGLAERKEAITHIILTTCTGFYAPGIDLDIIRHYGLKHCVERTTIGFMGCQAAMNALKTARHIVRSDPAAQILVVNLELCTLHMQETSELEKMLAFLLFADGCAASIVSAEATGLELQQFHTAVLPESDEQITWHIGDSGFDMHLARQVPSTIAKGLAPHVQDIMGVRSVDDMTHWAVHPGGSGILDAVEGGLSLPQQALDISRDVLRRFGNMSSATIMFVLKEVLAQGLPGLGCALAFGPGLTAETMVFNVV